LKEEQSSRFREITIPGDVLDDNELSDGAKIMYGKIARLSFKNGRCWAGNSFLDGTKSGRNASRFIAELKKAGYIAIENENSRKRTIKICSVNSRISEKNKETGDNLDFSTSPNLAMSDKPRQNWRSNPANSGDVTSPNLATEHLNITNLKRTAAAAGSDPPQKAAAASHSQKIKDALLEIDRTLLLSKDFYPKAEIFMAVNDLDNGYLSWLYEWCKVQKPNNLKAYFYTLFFEEDKIEEYKASLLQVPKPPQHQLFFCLFCGAANEIDFCYCPACELPQNLKPEQIPLFKEILKLPQEQRREFIKLESDIRIDCGLRNGDKYGERLEELIKTFGITVVSI
jgi:hypothetical protein